MQACPACQHEVQEELPECPYCGLIFAKWKSLHSRSAVHPLAKESPGTPIPGTLTWLIPTILMCALSSVLVFEMARSPALIAELAKENWDGGLILGSWGLVGSIGLFVYGLGMYRWKQRVGNVSTSFINSLTAGRFVQIAGIAQANGPILRAPVSQKPCVWFVYKEEDDENHEIVNKSSGRFFVRDMTGAISIDPVNAELMLENTIRFKSAESFFQRFFCREHGCTESFIPPGKTVYVLGTVCMYPQSRQDANDTVRLYIGLGRKEVFQISDRSVTDLLSHWSWQRFAWFLYGGVFLSVAFLYAILKWYATPGP